MINAEAVSAATPIATPIGLPSGTADSIQRSEEEFRTLFELSPVAVYCIDADGVVVKFNRHAAQLWGRAPVLGDTDEKFCGSHKMFLPDGTPLAHHECPMALVVNGLLDEAKNAEVVIERPDGSRVTVIVNIRPLRGPGGEITGAINCFYDVTERSRLEQKTRDQAQTLIDLDKRKDEFLAMLSHELRSPLAPLSNAARLLALQGDDAKVRRHASQIVERQVGHLKHLVDDLLEVSRITTGRVQLRQTLVVYGDAIEQAVGTVESLFADRKQTLTVSLPEQPVVLSADAARLEQILVNLLTNAAKYTDEGGQICLALSLEGDTSVVSVRDNGIGIPPELLPRVFDLFTQAERSLDRSQGGLGIGLALVRRLVDLQGGTVEVRSVLGEGSEFIVRFPALVDRLMVDQQPGTTPLPKKRRLKVLIVDDSHDAADTMAALLEISGHQVFTAFDGPTAVTRALDCEPDLMLLDIGLPGLNGFEVAKRVRREPALSHVVLVALTGYGQEADLLLSRNAGFDHHLVKPADFAAVEAILSQCERG